jgi:hypothetical protein
LGKDLIEDFVERSFRIAELALAGEDLSGLPVYPDNFPPMPEAEENMSIVQENYAEQTAEIDEWLRGREAQSQ